MGSYTVDRELFLETLAGWPSGVAVVTACDTAGQPWGFTASSFVSLSLDPPLVMVCLDKSAECRPVFEAASWFAVHILHSRQGDLARRFAVKGADKFAASDVTRGTSGLPLLSDTAGRLECRVVDRIGGGDHIILIGEVHQAVHGAGEPLIYYQRGFHRPEPVLDLPLSGR